LKQGLPTEPLTMVAVCLLGVHSNLNPQYI
jgi:hypothetical protein